MGVPGAAVFAAARAGGRMERTRRGRSHEKVGAGEPRLFEPGRRKSGRAGAPSYCAWSLFRGVLHALQEQLWGHFLHNRALVHRKGGRLRLIPVGDTPARGAGTQACKAPKFLARQGKKRLSTERGRPYYYHYLFIKKTKKKTGQPEDRGSERCEDGEQALRERGGGGRHRLQAWTCRKGPARPGKACIAGQAWAPVSVTSAKPVRALADGCGGCGTCGTCLVPPRGEN